MFAAVRSPKSLYFTYHSLQNMIHFYKVKFCMQKQNQVYAINITTYVAALRDIFIRHEKSVEDQCNPVQPQELNLIQQADYLFVQSKYMEAYELLNQLRFYSNVEVLWRMSRALFAMSCKESLTKGVREEMVNEAFQLTRTALKRQDDNANVHKWMAILLDGTAGNIGTYTRTKIMVEVKKHLLRALELNSADVTTLYLLGHWCYQLASLSWFQRKLAFILFTTPPSSSFEEAYGHFLTAEQTRPRFFIGNTYMLGKVCFHMKKYYRAKYYLDIAANMPWKTEHDRKCCQDAKKLSNELYHYDLSAAALFYKEEIN